MLTDKRNITLRLRCAFISLCFAITVQAQKNEQAVYPLFKVLQHAFDTTLIVQTDTTDFPKQEVMKIISLRNNWVFGFSYKHLYNFIHTGSKLIDEKYERSERDYFRSVPDTNQFLQPARLDFSDFEYFRRHFNTMKLWEVKDASDTIKPCMEKVFTNQIIHHPPLGYLIWLITPQNIKCLHFPGDSLKKVCVSTKEYREMILDLIDVMNHLIR